MKVKIENLVSRLVKRVSQDCFRNQKIETIEKLEKQLRTELENVIKENKEGIISVFGKRSKFRSPKYWLYFKYLGNGTMIIGDGDLYPGMNDGLFDGFCIEHKKVDKFKMMKHIRTLRMKYAEFLWYLIRKEHKIYRVAKIKDCWVYNNGLRFLVVDDGYNYIGFLCYKDLIFHHTLSYYEYSDKLPRTYIIAMILGVSGHKVRSLLSRKHGLYEELIACKL